MKLYISNRWIMVCEYYLKKDIIKKTYTSYAGESDNDPQTKNIKG